MDEALYNLMNWPEVEAIVYSEHDNPHSLLGSHKVDNGILIQCFFPESDSVKLKIGNNEFDMERTDEDGFFSILMNRRSISKYTYLVKDKEGKVTEVIDPYNFQPVIDVVERKLFASGINYSIYEKLGAHIMTLKGVKGVLFAVWAPNAIRVSVVGDFNNWDGRVHQMRRLEDSGIFELFIPGVKAGALYKFEMKLKGDITMMKSDPYGNEAELRPDTASIVTDLNTYHFKDKEWMKERKSLDTSNKPMVIYEVHLGSWKRKNNEGQDEFYNYREIAVELAEYVKKMGYTHIELMPVMEHPLDESWGYQVTGYYAATKRYGTPQDFMYFIDYMHQQGIGVILDWVPAHFTRDAFGLANFDGTCLYEDPDPQKGNHPQWGTLVFHYARPEVRNFLVANALFWVNKFHADGIRMDAVASMLYLDYGRRDGEWTPNVYGGKENLEAIELIRQISNVLHKKGNHAMLIAEESTSWPAVTKPVDEEGLGFDYKWNMGWMNDFLDYMKCDPLFRKGRHKDLLMSFEYAYTEKFILTLSHDEVTHGKASLLAKMPGDEDQKYANLRVAYAFMMGHPGKKLLFMGQEFAQWNEWNENTSLDWYLLEDEKHAAMEHYVDKLNHFYEDQKALYELDGSNEGFQWISNLDADHSIIAFKRKASEEKNDLLLVYNFTPVVYENFRLGVDKDALYQEIFNSDASEFGGADHLNVQPISAEPTPWDGLDYSINMTIPPMAVSVFAIEKKEEEKVVDESENAKDSKKIKEEIKEDIKEETEAEEVTEEKAEAEPETEAVEEVKAEPETETVEEVKAKPETETVEEVKAEPETETIEEVKAEPETEAIEEVKAEPETEVKEEVKAEPETEVKEEVKAEPETEVKEEVKAKPETEVVEEVKAEPETEVKEEVKAEPETEVKEEIKAEPVAEVQEEATVEPETEAVEEVKVEPVTEAVEEAKTEPEVKVIEEVKAEEAVTDSKDVKVKSEEVKVEAETKKTTAAKKPGRKKSTTKKTPAKTAKTPAKRKTGTKKTTAKSSKKSTK